MYTLVRHLGSPWATVREASSLTVSLVLAELCYKFHSFSLECMAFLATWMALSGLIEVGARLLHKANESNQQK
jgi:hypothetical protein